ncbi:MAG TPA: signal peptidase II [bacterium]|nr:signal peptidase II [bacterium]
MKDFVKKNKSKIFFVAVTVCALIIDRVSKFYVSGIMQSRSGREIELIPGFLSIIDSYNTGIAFGLMKGISYVYIYLPVVLVLVAVVLILRRGEKTGVFGPPGLGMMLGGAIGNLVDRVRFGRVYDFIDAYVGALHWPTFNAADSFIVIGVFLFAFAVFRGEFDV